MKYFSIAQAILDTGHYDPMAAKQLLDDIESIADKAGDITTEDHAKLMQLWIDVDAKANEMANDMLREYTEEMV